MPTKDNHSTPIDEKHTIRVQRRFTVSVEQLFHAWSDPVALAAWAWGSLGLSTQAEVDFRPGGSFRVETRRPSGETWSFRGSYVEIEPNRRIVHTLVWDASMGYPPADERLEVTFNDDDEGSSLELVHAGVPDDSSAAEHQRGWRNVLEALATHLEGA